MARLLCPVRSMATRSGPRYVRTASTSTASAITQGKDNLVLFPRDEVRTTGSVRCRHRLGGLLKFYHQAAA